MPRPTDGPWGKEKKYSMAWRPKPEILNYIEAQALKQAYETGRFSKASLARIYDCDWGIVDRVAKGTYRPRRD